MAHVYRTPALILNNQGQTWMQPTNFYLQDLPVSWLCAKGLSKLVYADPAKPLQVCISRKKPNHKQYLQFEMKGDEFMYFKNFPGLKRRELYGKFNRFVTRYLAEGYIWVEQ